MISNEQAQRIANLAKHIHDYTKNDSSFKSMLAEILSILEGDGIEPEK